MKSKKYYLNSIIDFGKYKGFTLEEVYKNKPDYISWCIENLWFFEIDQSIKDELEKDNIELISTISNYKKISSRMYANTKTWNPFVGCKYECEYCKVSFQRQYKRRGKKNHDCYYFIPHVHEERLNKIPNSEIVFVSGFGDISFCPKEYTKKIINSIIIKNLKRPDTIYYLQSKNPQYFKNFINILPNNVIILITLETNRDKNYNLFSKAPVPSKRYKDFVELDYPRKVITIEPIMDFDLEIFSEWLINAKPEYIWLGFNSRPKQVNLDEPKNDKVKNLIKILKNANIKVQPRCETRGINFDEI